MARSMAIALLFCLCFGGCMANVLEPTITQTSEGLRFSVNDYGYSLVAFHLSVNKDLAGTAAGDFNVDITSRTSGKWVYTAPLQLSRGDYVSYWVYAIKASTGAGVQLLGQKWTFGGSIPEPESTPAPEPNSTPVPEPNSTPVTEPESTPVPEPERNDTGNIPQAAGGPGIREGFVDSSSCKSYPCVIFEDNFDFLNHRVWEHEITANGGGNGEFQYYTNNRSNSYTRDGVLYIKPTLTADHFGDGFLESGTLDLWGHLPADTCTGNSFYGCRRIGEPGRLINPIQSARLRSSRGFNFRYGKVEVEAQMPAGDWVWPAVWMLPRLHEYGSWPASGEIDIVESRGNRNYRDSAQGVSVGADRAYSTLHYGPDYRNNRWHTAHASKLLNFGTFADGFHNFSVEWTDSGMVFAVDSEEILNVRPVNGFWRYAGFDQLNGYENPWREGSKMAPFDKEFYLVLNVAVGGAGGYFHDSLVNSPHPKPWRDSSGQALSEFWAAKGEWYPTWNPEVRNGEDAALKINRITVWKLKAD